jgi:uncharacterized membrane protein YvbJ
VRDCPTCGVSVNDDVETCPYCGIRLPLTASDPEYWDAELARLAERRTARMRQLGVAVTVLVALGIVIPILVEVLFR